jgi:5-methylcytosine-specific restriction endonuclease McrA
MSGTPLPEPESEQLAALLGSGSLRLVYGLLHRRRGNPPTADEIRFFLQASAAADGSVDRALRGLRDHFDVVAVTLEGTVRYQLRGWAGARPASQALPIGLRLRAQVLAPARCAQCGRTPLRHDVVLDVDWRVPTDWGGTNDPENLQPLCEECRDGKRQYLQTYAAFSEQISRAASFDEPQRRIGELLKALEHQWVPSDLIGIVASAKEYQEDYQRRLRDLRFLGWEYQTSRRYHEGARVKVYYRLLRAAPWPASIRAALTAEEDRRRKAKRR